MGLTLSEKISARAGARIVSGCCGSTPLPIAEIAKKVREIRLP